MTARKLDPYAQRLTDCDNWLLLPENVSRMTAAAAGRVTAPTCAAVLRLLVSRTNRNSGTVDQTYQQISAATLLSDDQVKRAITVLTSIGVLVTVTGSRSGGAGGAAGRAPVRRISFLSPVDIAGMAVQSDPIGGAVNGNGGAADCTPLRIISTHISTHLENDLSQNQNSTNSDCQQWTETVSEAVTARLFNAANSDQIKSPEAFRLSIKKDARRAAHKAEQRFREQVRLITPAHSEYGTLIDWCAAVASKQDPSPATYQLLETACRRQ